MQNRLPIYQRQHFLTVDNHKFPAYNMEHLSNTNWNLDCVWSYILNHIEMNETKTSIAPNSSESRAQRRNPSLPNSKEESREISMVTVVIREPGRRGARAEKPDRRNAF